MKIVAGVVAAGALAGGAVLLAKPSTFRRPPGSAEAAPGKPSTTLAAPPASAAPKDPDPDQVYRLEPIVASPRPADKKGLHRYNECGWGKADILNGPGLEAEFHMSDEVVADEAGNFWWWESGAMPIVRAWRAGDGRVTTLVGSAAGNLDGPLEVARLGSATGGGGYGGQCLAVSADGKHLFLRDTANGCSIRHVDLEAGTISTIGHDFVFARELSGDVYVLAAEGGNVPPGKGYKTMAIPKLEDSAYWTGWRVLDLAKNRLYFSARGAVCYWDLKTGKRTFVTAKEKGRGWTEGGPLETAGFWCPIGLTISPRGRYLFVGGGDGSTLHRLDLEKGEMRNLGLNPDGTVAFKTGTEKGFMGACPGSMWLTVDGSGCWSTCNAGIFRLVPVK